MVMKDEATRFVFYRENNAGPIRVVLFIDESRCNMDIIFVLAVAIFIEKSCSQILVASPTCFVDGNEVKLECTTADFNQGIGFALDTVIQGGCAHPSCTPNIVQSGKVTTYTLSFNSSTHSGNWTCTYGSSQSPVVVIAENPCALTISRSGSNELESTTYTLKCEIPGLNNQATWSKKGVAVAIFVNGVNTLPPESPYSYRQDSSAIYVDFSKLAKIEHNKKWTCAHIGRTDVHFTVQVDSSKIVAIECGVASAFASHLVAIFSGVLFTFIRFVVISSAVAENWYFSNRHVFRGRVVYGLHIAIVGAVLQISSVIITLVVVLRYPGQFNHVVTGFIAFLFCITSSLGILVFCLIVAIFGKSDRLDERDDDARCFKMCLLVIVVVFPIAWLVLLIIGLWRWCKKDDSTSNRENGNDHAIIFEKNMSNRGNEKQVLTPIPGVDTQNSGESKLNQNPFGNLPHVRLPPINSPKE